MVQRLVVRVGMRRLIGRAADEHRGRDSHHNEYAEGKDRSRIQLHNLLLVYLAVGAKRNVRTILLATLRLFSCAG